MPSRSRSLAHLNMQRHRNDVENESVCWGSNDGFIWEERTAFIIRRVFAKARTSAEGELLGEFDFAESITSASP